MYRGERTGGQITLAEQLGKAGGEGSVFRVRNLHHTAFKLYKERPDRAKLDAILRSPPSDRHGAIAWPTDIVVDEHGTARGLLLPLVPGQTYTMDQLYNTPERRRLVPQATYRHLLQVAEQIAECVDAIHGAGHCIGDLNERNFLLSEQTQSVTIVDCDSMQIKDRQTGKVFPCLVGVADYVAPELLNKRVSERSRDTDNFALGVMVFRLLMLGQHPFEGAWKLPGDQPRREEKIRNGLFAYGGRREIGPPPGTPPIGVMAPELQELVQRCFVEGHQNPRRRPQATEWIWALRRAKGSLRRCRQNRYHLFGSHLTACPWCEYVELLRRNRLTIVDPFPGPYQQESIDVGPSRWEEFVGGFRERSRPAARAATGGPAPAPVGPQPLTGNLGLLSRSYALAIDLLFIVLLSGTTIGISGNLLSTALGAVPGAAHALAYGFVVAVFYGTVFEAWSGRTLGKWVVGIRVVNAKSLARPGVGAALLRNIWKYLGVGLCWPLLIGAVLGRQGRTVGDRHARTLVVRPGPARRTA